MLPAARNKVTISILEKLRAKGPAPKGSAAPSGGLMGQHDDEEGADDMGGDGSIMRSGISTPALDAIRKAKKKPEDDEDEES